MEKLMGYLEGNLFHVTRKCNWDKIKACGEICPNINGEFEPSFGNYENSYYKNKGCVSVFDYRNIYEKKAKRHRYKCLPTDPLSPDSGIAILLFKPEIEQKLLLWDDVKNKDYSQTVVPYVEAGHHGSISLSLVEKIIIVTMSERHNDLAAILREI